MEQLFTDNFFIANGNVSYTFRNGVPHSITQRTTPYLEQEGADDLGIFAQDQWRINRLTFNYGVRFDYVNGYVPAQDMPGTPDEKFYDRFPGVPLTNPWVGERNFDARSAAFPSWKDINPRLGVAVGHVRERPDGAQDVARPVRGQDQRGRRRAAQPDYDVRQQREPLLDRYEQELRPGLRPGQLREEWRVRRARQPELREENPNAVRWSDDVREGWGVRDYNWEFGPEVQHELTQGLSVTAAITSTPAATSATRTARSG